MLPALSPSFVIDPMILDPGPMMRQASFASDSASTTTKPMPMLNVRYISSSSTLPCSCKKRKMGCGSRGSVISKPSWEMRRSLSRPEPVMCARPCTSHFCTSSTISG